jgi:mono/diheme cytochrome c family protein
MSERVPATAALVLWVGAVFAGPAAVAGSGGASQDKAQIERGMKVYADQKCSVCHSIAGKGNVKGPLDDVGSRLTNDQIREWMVNPAEMTKKTKAERKPLMRAYPNLSNPDLDAVIAYMSSLKKK